MISGEATHAAPSNVTRSEGGVQPRWCRKLVCGEAYVGKPQLETTSN